MDQVPQMSQTKDPFYRDGRIYDLMHERLVADKDFFVQTAIDCGGPVLEIACGTGRITIPIALAKTETFGLDIAEGMLNEARKKALELGAKVTWIQSDCRNFDIDKEFKFIFIPFNSMQHLHDRDSLESFFNCVKRHLSTDGTFVLDVFNPNLQLLARDRTLRTKVMSLCDPETGMNASIDESMAYDAAAQVNRVKWFYSLEDKPDYRVDELNMRCFFPEELDSLVHYNGFDIAHKFGNFDRSPFSSSSPKQILFLKKSRGAR